MPLLEARISEKDGFLSLGLPRYRMKRIFQTTPFPLLFNQPFDKTMKKKTSAHFCNISKTSTQNMTFHDTFPCFNMVPLLTTRTLVGKKAWELPEIWWKMHDFCFWKACPQCGFCKKRNTLSKSSENVHEKVSVMFVRLLIGEIS